MAGRAGALDGEEALGCPDRAGAAAGAAGLGVRAGLCARALADIAGRRRRHPDLRGPAGKSLGEADLHIVAKIGAACGACAPGPAPPAAGAAAAHELAEQILEDVRHGGGEFRTEARARTAAHAAFEGRMAETIIGSLLLRVLQDVIGFADFLELVLGRLV